jgi:predicted PurR-regulated permease PerM
MDPGGLGSRLLTEGVVITALVTVGLMSLMAIGYLSDVLGAMPRRVAVATLLFLILAAMVAVTAQLFPDAVQRAYDYVNTLSYK